MPFVGTQRAKDLITRKVMPERVGDLCCLAYVPMVEKWLANPSWTTLHRIKSEVDEGTWHSVFIMSRIQTIPPHLQSETETAVTLAWEVFFALYGVPYELDKKKKNGGVLTKED